MADLHFMRVTVHPLQSMALGLSCSAEFLLRLTSIQCKPYMIIPAGQVLTVSLDSCICDT